MVRGRPRDDAKTFSRDGDDKPNISGDEPESHVSLFKYIKAFISPGFKAEPSSTIHLPIILCKPSDKTSSTMHLQTIVILLTATASAAVPGMEAPLIPGVARFPFVVDDANMR